MSWAVKLLGDVIQRTETVDPTKDPNKQFSYVDVSGVSNQTFTVSEPVVMYGKDAPSRARKLIRTGDVLFATVRPTLKRIAIVPEPLDHQVASTGYFVLRPKQELNNRYLFYFLLSDQFQERMEKMQKGASYPAVTDTEVKAEGIPLAPLPEQQRIVGKLDAAFAALTEAQAHVERNRANAGELFESYLNGVFEGKDEWVTRPLHEIIHVKHGFAFLGEYFTTEGDHVLLTMGNFFEKGGYRDRGEKQKYYTGPVPEDFVLSKGDLVVAMTEQAAGLLGSPLLVPESGKYLHNQRIGLVQQPHGQVLLNEFLFHVFNTKPFRDAVHASGSGVKVRHTSPTKIGEVEVMYPTSLKEQKRIVDALASLQLLTRKLETTYQQKLSELEGLKKGLLGAAFRGEL